jgi:CO/xanthine dehydrogenase Mo-binding subunit
VPEGEVQQDGLAFGDRRDPARRIALGALARAAALATAALGVEPGLESTRFFQPPDIAYSSGAHVALVEVDRHSAQVRILGYWVSHDSGRLVNPMVVDGQIHGGVALGIGGALLEEIAHDATGQPRAASYMDYLLPTALDVPRMTVDHAETLSPLNPLGIKGVGESGALPVAAVLASAIEDAVGRPVVRVPVNPMRLHALLHPAPGGDGAADA